MAVIRIDGTGKQMDLHVKLLLCRLYILPEFRLVRVRMHQCDLFPVRFFIRRYLLYLMVLPAAPGA